MFFILDAYSGRSRMPLSLKRWATWGNRADGLAYSLKLDSLLTTHYSPNPPPPPAVYFTSKTTDSQAETPYNKIVV